MAIALPSKNIILIGFMGSGKSTIGHILASDLGFKFIDTDTLIEKKEKRSIKDIFQENGEAYFRQCEKEIFDDHFSSLTQSVISTGGGFPIGIENIDSKGYVVFLNIPYEKIIERLSHDEKGSRPLLADPQKGEELYLARQPLYTLKANLIADATQPPKEVAKQIISHYNVS